MKLEEFDQRAAKLSPDEVEMESELELSMHRITQWELVYFDGKYIYYIFLRFQIKTYCISFNLRISTRSRLA